MRKYPNADHEWTWQWVFPASPHYVRPHDRHPASSPPARIRDPKGGPRGGPAGRHCQTRDEPHVSAFGCQASAGGPLRHSDGAGTPGAQGRQDDNRLHALIRGGLGFTARWRGSASRCRSTLGVLDCKWRGVLNRQEVAGAGWSGGSFVVS